MGAKDYRVLAAHCSLPTNPTMHLEFLYDLLGQYGIYAVFILVVIEGDITLLIAGVMAQSGFFGPHSFLWVMLAGTLGGAASDNIRSEERRVGKGWRSWWN